MNKSVTHQQTVSSTAPATHTAMLAALACLVLTIGLTVGAMAWRVSGFHDSMTSLGTVDPALGYAFYDGIDQVLAGQGSDALEQVVAGGFVDHAADTSDGRSRDQMIEQLTTFAAAFPQARMKVIDIQTAPGALIATLAPLELSGSFADGLSVTTNPISGGYELLRVRNGAIVERWNTGLPQLEINSAPDAAYEIGATMSDTIQLSAIELPDDSTVTWKGGGGAHTLLAESGTLHVDTRWVDSEGEDMHSSDRISDGQAISPVPGSTVTLRADSDDSSDAVFLLLTVKPVRPGDEPGPTLGPGAKLSLLWSSNLPDTLFGTWTLSLGKLTVPAGISVQLQGASDTKLLLTSAVGTGRVTAMDGDISTLDSAFHPVASGGASVLVTGDAAFVDGASLVELESIDGETVTVWVISARLDPPPTDATASPVATPE